MRGKIVVFLGIIIILTLSFGLFKEYKEVTVAKEHAGQGVSLNVNLMSIYVKGVLYSVTSSMPTKPMSENRTVTNDELFNSLKNFLGR